MVWAAFDWGGKTEIVFTNEKLDSKKYQDLLMTHLLPHAHTLGGQNWIFQQDNAPCHASKSTKKWLLEHNIVTLDWPSISPDLNPMENLWGVIVRKIYQNRKQFNSVESLKATITKSWDELNGEVLQHLINSMKNRMFELIKSKGESINYQERYFIHKNSSVPNILKRLISFFPKNLVYKNTKTKIIIIIFIHVKYYS